VPISDDKEFADVIDTFHNIGVALMVILAFSLLTSTFAMPLVEDRERMFKNQVGRTRALNNYI